MSGRVILWDSSPLVEHVWYLKLILSCRCCFIFLRPGTFIITHECFTACASSKVMGRRKFRLGIHRKNEERAKHTFIVSIQRTDVVVHVSTLAVTTSELETPVDPSPLTCSVPLIVISEGVVQTLDALATRLRLLNPFTSWTVADQGVLIISKMHFVVTQSPKVFSYCVSINQELQWSLSIQNKVISLDACLYLALVFFWGSE